MDWMYKNPSSVDPEEYLLGRAVDKNHFKETSPVNYMRSIKNEPQSSYGQAEVSRKIKEDPLTALKEKEIESKRLLFQKLQLKRNESLVPFAAVSQSEKKESKSIEQLIIENLRKLPCSVNLEKLLVNIKEEKKLKKLRKNTVGSPVSKYKLSEKESSTMRKRARSSSSSVSDSDEETKKRKTEKQRFNTIKKLTKYDGRKDQYNSQDKSDEKEERSRISSRCNTEYNSKNQKKFNEDSSKCDRIGQNSHGRSKGRADVRKTDLISKEKDTRKSKEENSEGRGQRKCGRLISEEQNIRQKKDKFSDKRYHERHRYVGRNKSPENVEEKKKEEKESTSDKKIGKISSEYVKNRKCSRDLSKEKVNPIKKPTLTEEEKEAKRKEMMANAIERDVERKKNVKRYALEDQKEEKIEKFDDDFARRQLSSMMSSENSVEKRIKSNVYNIQRSSRDMDRNFARRY